MKQDDENLTGMEEQPPRPKPLRKLKRISSSNDAFNEYPPVNNEYHGKYEVQQEIYREQHEAPAGEYHGQHEAPAGEYHGQHEAPAGEYHGQHEAPSGEYHGQHEAPSGEYHGQHEAPSGEYHGQHEATAREYKGQHEAPSDRQDNGIGDIGRFVMKADAYSDEFELKGEKHFSLKDFVVKSLAVVTSIAMIGALVVNMPIFVDKKTGGNVSMVYLLKHQQTMAKEGEIDKTNFEYNLNTETVAEDYNDGLDLPQRIEGQYSILFLGFDEDEFNTDVMWVVQFDIGHGAMNILQIPRDCCLPDYTTSESKKFNSIYSCGNPDINPPIQRVVNAVQENFQIPIDAYMTTACFDIVRMVDIIGGIPMHLDNEIIYEADKIIPAGDVVLTGEQAEWFVRFRHEWMQGDIGRMQNQRRFMAAAMLKLFSIVETDGKVQLYNYLKKFQEEDLIYTDLSIDDMAKIANFASTLTMDNVNVNMVPGEDAWYYPGYDPDEKYSVYSVHKQETIDMLNKYFRPYQMPLTWDDTALVELVTEHEYSVYDDTGASFDELENATEPMRDPDKKPWWKED